MKTSPTNQYRKKPVVIEARQHTAHDGTGAGFDQWRDNGCALIDWINHNSAIRRASWSGGCISIETLEGTMLASPGDWIIRGVRGEFYPCKPDVFEATYEPVSTHESALVRSGDVHVTSRRSEVLEVQDRGIHLSTTER